MHSFSLVLKSLVALIAFVIINVTAQSTTLYIPDTDPQPISVDIIGVGSDGRTTFLVQSVENTDPQGLFPTATLVEGPSDAVLSFATTIPTENGGPEEGLEGFISCAIDSNGQAICNQSAKIVLGTLTTGSSTVLTESAIPITVAFGGTLSSPPPASTSSTSTTPESSSSSASIPSPSSGSGSSTSESTSSSNGSLPASTPAGNSTTNNNGGQRGTVSGMMLAITMLCLVPLFL